jgi:pilus assembly protein CpaF
MLDTDAENIYDGKLLYKELKKEILKDLIETMRQYADETDSNKLKQIAHTKILDIINKKELKLDKSVVEKLDKELSDEVAGLGVLEDFLSDDSVSEIMVNGKDEIFVEKYGKIIKTDSIFESEEKIKLVIDRIVSRVGRRIDESSPIVDARLKDGSRISAAIAPISLNGPVLTIRKFLKDKLSVDSLIESGTATEKMFEFLKIAVIAKQNIIISGGTGTGKTTLLNAISSYIPEGERLITIEDSAEIQLRQEHVIRLESRPKSVEGTGEISIRKLVISALRMRPDRIIIGECRSGEALDMLQAMTTGHEGSLTTLHANSADDVIARLIVMVLMSGVNLPEKSVISQIASAIDIVVQLERSIDGSRKIVSISALTKTADEKIYEIKPVFLFKKCGIKNGVQKGTFEFTGFVPEFAHSAHEKF